MKIYGKNKGYGVMRSLYEWNPTMHILFYTFEYYSCNGEEEKYSSLNGVELNNVNQNSCKLTWVNHAAGWQIYRKPRPQAKTEEECSSAQISFAQTIKASKPFGQYNFF